MLNLEIKVGPNVTHNTPQFNCLRTAQLLNYLGGFALCREVSAARGSRQYKQSLVLLQSNTNVPSVGIAGNRFVL